MTTSLIQRSASGRLALLAGLCALLAATISMADERTGRGGQLYVTPGAVFYEGPDDDDIGMDDGEIGGGVAIGYGISDRWAIEFLWGKADNDFNNNFGSGDGEATLRWLDLVYNFQPTSNWQPFVLFGGGRSEYEFSGARPDARDNQFNAGVGVMRALGEHFALRADVRGVSTNKDGGSLTPFAFVGLTGYLGSSTPPPPPPDSDGDGVPNDQDKCPTTPPGRVVDADGCELDSDGDGVVDGDDRCPNTPAGAPVDSSGCPLDSDGDGVPDYLDECPDTSKGAKVDEKGCYIELEETVTIDMNIIFDTNEAVIRSDQTPEVNRAITFLRQYPTANATIEGHTDSSGSAAYNQALSERRAKAVYDYLINIAGIAAERLSWAGFGEERPIASNDTPEGRQQNRRVSAVVEGKQTVRQ